MLTITSIGDQYDYHIKTYDIDHDKLAMPVSLLRMMHETAMQNVIRLGISVWDLEPQQLAWVLTNMYIDFYRLPRLGEHIQIFTQPAGFERVFTYRDYQAVDEDGNILFSAASTWLLMNVETRRMSNIPDFIRHFKDDLPPEKECLNRAKLRLKAPENPSLNKDFRVDWHDLDFNQHTNNVNYVRWMLETLGTHLSDHRLKRLEIQFKSESHWNDQLEGSATALDGTTFVHQLAKVGEEKPLALAKTFWGKR